MYRDRVRAQSLSTLKVFMRVVRSASVKVSRYVLNKYEGFSIEFVEIAQWYTLMWTTRHTAKITSTN